MAAVVKAQSEVRRAILTMAIIAMAILWLYYGYTMAYYGYTMAILWLYYGYTMAAVVKAQSEVRVGIAATPSCTLVHRREIRAPPRTPVQVSVSVEVASSTLQHSQSRLEEREVRGL